MKPENYSLKFQNSLADSRIIPGSQPGKGPISNAPKARNGHRAPRKLTKYQQSVAAGKVGKKTAMLNSKPETKGDTRKMEDHLKQRATEKESEAARAATMTGMWSLTFILTSGARR